MTVKADKAELHCQSNAVVQTIQCPLSCAHFGNLGRQQGLAMRGSGSKCERTGSQVLPVTDVFLFWAHQLILFLCSPCSFRSKVLCITVSHYWYSLNSIGSHRKYLTWTPAESHLSYCADAVLNTKKNPRHLGLTENRAAAGKNYCISEEMSYREAGNNN